MAKKSDKHTKPKKKHGLRSQIIVALLMATLGFGIVVQVRQIKEDDLSGLRQDDLVQLLDEVTRRNEALTQERSQLRQDRSQLQSGSDQSDYLENYARMLSMLSGAVPVHGTGIEVRVNDPTKQVASHHMVHMLVELRNAGAEAVSVNGVRLAAGSYFIDTASGILADGEVLTSPYDWKAVGNISTLAGALEIPGGALAGFRNTGASVSMVEREELTITATREVKPLEFATPNPESK